MKYMDIWAKPQPRPKKQAQTHHELPKRVKDWPPEAKAAFKHVKNELWKWAKAKPGRDRAGLALIAYVGVKEAFEGEVVKATIIDDVITCKTMEGVWTTLLSLKSQP